ncbi:MAG: hypothetical protein RJA44_2374, partial [Pseudomonadota bacterium]
MGPAPDRPLKTVRIFLASPSADTLDARARVVAVIREIGADALYSVHVQLNLQRWDDPARPVVCNRAGNPQQDIIQQVGSPADCDLVIGIFAHTMGGTLPPERFAPLAGRDEPWFCTEWEVEQALQAGRDVWIWHDQRPLTDNTAKAKRQSLAVSEYIERHNPPGGPMREGYNLFKDEGDLADKLRHGLREWLRRKFIPVSTHQVPVTAAVLNPVEQQLHRYLDNRLANEFDDRAERYVPLAGLERVSRSPHNGRRNLRFAPRLDYSACDGAGGYGEPVPHDDVLAVYRNLPAERQKRLAVLGEPGAGKSFSLERLFCALAEAVLPPADGVSQPAPLLLRLGDWTDPQQTLAQFLEAHLRDAGQPLLAGQWQELRRQRPLVLLLDAYNEIPVGQRRDKAQQVQ